MTRQGDLWSLKQIILSVLLLLWSGLIRNNSEMFLVSSARNVPHNCCLYLPVNFWTVLIFLSFGFFWGYGWKLSDCSSANPSLVAFEPAVQLHLNLKEGRNLKLQVVWKLRAGQKRENKMFVLPVHLRERQERFSCFIFCLVTGSRSASINITFYINYLLASGKVTRMLRKTLWSTLG